MDDKTLLDLFGSLSGEISALRQEFSGELSGLRQEMKDGFDRIEARLGRQGGIIQGGTRHISRLISWSEDIDELLAQRDRRIEDLTRRVEKLEGNKPAA